MKTKRSGYLQKTNQLLKKKPVSIVKHVDNSIDLDDDKKKQDDCNGCCAISWKPQTVAR